MEAANDAVNHHKNKQNPSVEGVRRQHSGFVIVVLVLSEISVFLSL